MALQSLQRIPLTLGIPLSGSGATGSINLSTATRRVAYSFIAQGKTLDSVRCYCVGKGGTVVAADSVCDLFSDSTAGIPNASIVSKTADAAAVNNTWSQWSSFAQALTAGQRYWLVLKNVNGTPGTNNFQFAHASGQTVAGGWLAFQSSTLGWGWNKVDSTYSGSTWGGAASDAAIMRIKYTDGTFDGTGIQQIVNMTAANCVYDKREVGSVFTVPTGLNAYVRGVAMNIWKTGTPSGNLRFRLYRGTTLLGTTNEVPVGNLATGDGNYVSQYFSSSFLINAGDTIRVVSGVSATGDTNSNRYNHKEYQVENDADSKLLKPFDGTISMAVLADNTTTTWTDTDTSYVPFVLMLDTSGEFASGGGGGYPASRSFLGA